MCALHRARAGLRKLRAFALHFPSLHAWVGAHRPPPTQVCACTAACRALRHRAVLLHVHGAQRQAKASSRSSERGKEEERGECVLQVRGRHAQHTAPPSSNKSCSHKSGQVPTPCKRVKAAARPSDFCSGWLSAPRGVGGYGTRGSALPPLFPPSPQWNPLIRSREWWAGATWIT